MVAGAAILIVAAVIGGVLVYQEYQKRDALRDIIIEAEGLQVEGLSLTSADLTLSVKLTNPNSVTATLDRANFTIFLENQTLGEGSVTTTVEIPPGGSRTLDIPFGLNYSDAIMSAWVYLTQETTTWRAVGTAHVATPLGTLDIPFNLSGVLENDILVIPRVELPLSAISTRPL